MNQQEFQELTRLLADTPEKVRQLTSDLATHDLYWKPSEKQWSIVEHVCHLNDIEQEGYTVRIKRLLNEDQPFLHDIDGDKLAEERNYNSQNFAAALSTFTRARKENVRTIKNLPLDQLDRSGTFEHVGAITLGKLLMLMREHDRGHLQSISKLLDQLFR